MVSGIHGKSISMLTTNVFSHAIYMSRFNMNILTTDSFLKYNLLISTIKGPGDNAKLPS